MAAEGFEREPVAALQEAITRHAQSSLGTPWWELSSRGQFNAVALAVRDFMIERAVETERRYHLRDPKRLYYLSIEYLIGRSLGANLRNLGLYERCQQALTGLGSDLGRLEENEPDAALGNGGLGRLAACFLDSLATLGMPGYGYGINYEYGLFRQEIANGYQRELPDNWLAHGSPWQIPRPDEICIVPIYGHIEDATDRHGIYNPMWMGWRALIGFPYDMLIPGYGGHAVHFLRLYSARSSRDFDMQIFNDGDYIRAVEQKIQSEMISKVLYPSDSVIVNQELRLAQEYFLAACSIRDVLRRFEKSHQDLRDLPLRIAIQLNDTHPALAIAELMRVLVDERNLPWEEAWKVSQKCFGYTNHTLSPEALEKWPVSLLSRMVPRHLQIIAEIDRRVQQRIAAAPEPALLDRISPIDKREPQQVRMVNLAVIGSHSVNGVSPIHTSLLQNSLLADFCSQFPARFNNKTNGISPRRWLLHANPLLSDLINATIGDRWIVDLDQLRSLEAHEKDSGFLEAFRRVRQSNKVALCQFVRDELRMSLDPHSIVDVQIKRIHAYKRQLLNVLKITYEYIVVTEDGKTPPVPCTYIFAGKAAPGYRLAKQIIKLIHEVARVVNSDPRSEPWMRVLFLPDYRVTLAEKIIRAADISEQISTAGTEASGTGNMKLALNGAVMIGTRDGTNIDISNAVGEENVFLFGLRSAELQVMREKQSYRPPALCEQDSRLRRVVDAFRSDLFSRDEPGLFSWVPDLLLDSADEHIHLADLPGYLDAHQRASHAFCDRECWSGMSIRNIARIGSFSSDRTIREYARDIWEIQPC